VPQETVPQSPHRQAPVSLLDALAEVAKHLATRSDAIDEGIPLALGVMRRALDARQCALWLHGPRGLIRGWSDGDQDMRGEQVLQGLMGADLPPSLTVFPLEAAGRRLGAAALLRDAPLEDAERSLLATFANLIAPSLTYAEHSRQLEVEVAVRTRQIDEQRRFTERIIDSLPVGLYVIDPEYRIQAWNRKRETGMQGVSREEAIGRPIFEILHRQPEELLRAEFDDVFSSGRIQQFQMESSATGDLRTYRISKIPMRLDDTAVTHVITIGEDVTEWREATDRFSQAEKLAAIGQLAAGVMHEINNPLATIAACAESLAMRADDMAAAGSPLPEFSEYLKIIDSEVHRCKRIVDGLLEFSRPRPATRTLVSVNDVVEQTLFLLKHHARFKKLTVHSSLDPELGTNVRGNPDQMIQVVMALLLNAVDAMRERGTVTIRTRAGREAGEGAIIEVIDEGHGIPRGEMSKIFEPFYTTKPPGRGTGLGLSICYGIVAAHGGRLEVDSTPGEGTVFRVILPLSSETA
jgi:two-component system, NtrC family, sensor kinase